MVIVVISLRNKLQDQFIVDDSQFEPSFSEFAMNYVIRRQVRRLFCSLLLVEPIRWIWQSAFGVIGRIGLTTEILMVYRHGVKMAASDECRQQP
ncbi:MAG: hypothetical protein WKF77_19720 [Planctomycetaceae bacterium]